MTDTPKALYLSHGGGPLPVLGDPGHQEMVTCLEHIAASIPKPEAIIVVSAHWEEAVPTITAGQQPSLIYDYYGFPKESYEITYPCQGNRELATELFGLLEHAGIEARLDETRGFDHGHFIPLKLMYPAADIPTVQLSLVASLDPTTHIALGQALNAIAKRNILLIGSGFSFHNLRMFSATDTQSKILNHAFEAWLVDTCSRFGYTEQARSEMLIEWSKAPGARFCHPREEHLLPLHVCYGLAGGACTESYELTIMGRKSSMYLW